MYFEENVICFFNILLQIMNRQLGVSKLSQCWRRSMYIFKSRNISSAKKILIYKVFFRPLLIHLWFQENSAEVKKFEVQALKKIFKRSTQDAYGNFTDVNVGNYFKIQQIKWRMCTGAPTSAIRKLLNACTRFSDPSEYFTRAARRRSRILYTK